MGAYQRWLQAFNAAPINWGGIYDVYEGRPGTRPGDEGKTYSAKEIADWEQNVANAAFRQKMAASGAQRKLAPWVRARMLEGVGESAIAQDDFSRLGQMSKRVLGGEDQAALGGTLLNRDMETQLQGILANYLQAQRVPAGQRYADSRSNLDSIRQYLARVDAGTMPEGDYVPQAIYQDPAKALAIAQMAVRSSGYGNLWGDYLARRIADSYSDYMAGVRPAGRGDLGVGEWLLTTDWLR